MNKRRPVKTHATNSRKDIRVILKNHAVAARDSINQLVATPVTSCITILVIGITLLLPTCLFLILKTVQHVTLHLHHTNRISIYLKTNTTQQDIDRLVASFQKNPKILSVKYISPSQALQELIQDTNYKDIVDNIEGNPLPGVILLLPSMNSENQLQSFIAELSHLPQIDTLHFDINWMKRLLTFINFGNKITLTLTVLFSIGILFMISHSISTATQRNQEEMKLLEQLGAPTPYIRRPFLYIGTLLGAAGGLFSIFLIMIILAILNKPLLSLFDSYRFQYSPLFIIKPFFGILLLSLFLGWLGAWLAFYKKRVIALNN